MRTQKQGWLGLYLLVGVAWGCSFLFIALGNQFLTPVGVGFWRQVLGGLPLLALALIQKRKFPRSPRTWFYIFCVSLFMNSIPSALFAFAERHVTSGFAGIMNASTPISTILMILMFFRAEKPTAKVYFGLAVGLVGVLTVLSVWNGLGNNDPMAVLALCCASLLYGIGGPFARRFVGGLGLEPQVQVPLQVLMAAITLAPFYATGPLLTAAPTPAGIGAMVVLGVIGTGFTYIWYYKLMAVAGSAIANSVTYMSPVVAVVAGTLLLGETATWNQLLGGIVVILGAALSQGRLDGLIRRLTGNK